MSWRTITKALKKTGRLISMHETGLPRNDKEADLSLYIFSA